VNLHPRAALVAVGDELLGGEIADGNSAWLASRLIEHGYEPTSFTVVGDDVAPLEHKLRELCAANELVVATGGLGPTLDDITREAVARTAGVPLERDEPVLQALEAWFRARGREMPRANERQALFPRGARILPNPLGTACGFSLDVGGCTVAALPGPPHEMGRMFEHELLPHLRPIPPKEARARFYLLGLSESEFADAAGEWMARTGNPLMGVTAKAGVLTVLLRSRGESRSAALELLDRRCAEFRARFGKHVFSEREADPALAVGAELLRAGKTLAVAESCTGGLLCAVLTEVPGISAVLAGGVVAYSNSVKLSELSVPPALLERHGAVSQEVAGAMALGVSRRFGTGLGIAVTGIAGPSGGSADKPVGTVCFGLSEAGSVQTLERRFPPVDRASVRRYAVNVALDCLRRTASAAGH
jgi:nicotinamide-nucleotide amidase